MARDAQDEVRFLSQENVIEAGGTDVARCVSRMDRVFELYDEGRVAIGQSGQDVHGHMTTFPDSWRETTASRLRPGSRFGAMPAYVGGDVDMVGVKWYGSVTARDGEESPPRSVPLLVLSDPETGRPSAVMDAGVITAMRTGAMAALGASYFQGDGAETATILGPGAIGQASALALDATLESLSDLRIYHPMRWKAVAFRDAMAERCAVGITATDSLRDAVGDADVVVAATPPSSPPKIDAAWLADESTVVQLGDLRIDLAAFERDRVVCDLRRHPPEFDRQVGWAFTRAYVEFLEGADAGSERSTVRAFHEIVGGTDTDPTDGRTILSSLGLPMEDVAWGAEVYRNAVTENAGRVLPLRNEPYFSTPY